MSAASADFAPDAVAPAAPQSLAASEPRRRRTSRKASGALLRLASVAACLLAWQVLAARHADLGVVTFRNTPTPVAVARALAGFVTSAKFAADVAASLWRVLAGFGAAAVLGVAAGVAVGRSRVAEALLMPPMELLRPIPAVAWIPLAVLMFPSSEVSMMSITFVGAVFPILLNTVHGAESVDPRLVAAARSLGANTAAVLVEVVVPAAAPAVFTGLAIGMGTAWFCLVTAEMISGQYGIGYFTWESYTLQNYDDIVVGMILIGVLGMGGSLLVKRVGLLLCPWTRLRVKA